jgi:hypothetical protein
MLRIGDVSGLSNRVSSDDRKVRGEGSGSAGDGDLKTGEFGWVVVGTKIDVQVKTVYRSTAFPTAEAQHAPIPGQGFEDRVEAISSWFPMTGYLRAYRSSKRLAVIRHILVIRVLS